jgi:hypothetical protein
MRTKSGLGPVVHWRLGAVWVGLVAKNVYFFLPPD